jgi:hypothetical protein
LSFATYEVEGRTALVQPGTHTVSERFSGVTGWLSAPVNARELAPTTSYLKHPVLVPSLWSSSVPIEDTLG